MLRNLSARPLLVQEAESAEEAVGRQDLAALRCALAAAKAHEGAVLRPALAALAALRREHQNGGAAVSGGSVQQAVVTVSVSGAAPGTSGEDEIFHRILRGPLFLCASCRIVALSLAHPTATTPRPT